MASWASKYHLKKAGFAVCLFLLGIITTTLATDNVWKFDPSLQRAYQLVLNLQTEKAETELKRLGTNQANALHKLYVESFNETLDVLISEDEQKFNLIEERFKERFKYLDGLKPSAETLFLKAELNLQRGFNFLNLGQEINAVLAIRTAYNQAQECIKKYPQFIPILKTNGVIQVMIGSVPDKYHWFMSLLGMKGSVVTGQKQLQSLRQSESSLNTEATILYYTIKGLINQQHEEATTGILSCLDEQPANRLVLFLGVNMLMKNSQSEKALELIQTLDREKDGLPMHYIDYLRGEIFLQRGNYDLAVKTYQNFINNYKSINFKKDANFKIAMAYHLLGKEDMAWRYFDIAKKTGKDLAEPDRYAAAQLREENLPNAKLFKVRMATDGGYYPEAKDYFRSISPADLKNEKDRTEYYYRRARLADKTGDLKAAKIYYEQTIDMVGDKPWYFAANSALQLGYLAHARKDYPQAKVYFEKALSYKKHEYKNSIDGKAKSALEQLKTVGNS